MQRTGIICIIHRKKKQARHAYPLLLFPYRKEGLMHFILPKYDECAKELFGNEFILKYFLSDLLGIHAEDIRSLKFLNPFLKRRYRGRKLGILDILAEMNDNTKINIEIQLKFFKEWDKRQLFYLSKMYTADLLVGENYTKLKRCIVISILDFNLNAKPDCHRIYHLRDKDGNLFSNLFEVHILELNKPLSQNKPVNDWIHLLNARSWEELDMIKTKNPGIMEAVKELKRMSLSHRLRYHFEAYLKEIRDAKAREEYVREEGVAQGLETALQIQDLHRQGLKDEEISRHTNVPLDTVRKLLRNEP